MNHFGPVIAADLRKRRLKPHGTWHLDEVYLKIDGRMVYLWRAVDAEGEVLDVLVQSKRNKHAALKLMRKLEEICLRPRAIGHRRLASYSAAVHVLGIEHCHERGRWMNNRAENSHQPTRRRERKMQRFKTRVRRRNFSPHTPPSTTPLTPNAISPRPKRITCFALRLWTRGGRRSQRPDCSLRRQNLRARPRSDVTKPHCAVSKLHESFDSCVR